MSTNNKFQKSIILSLLIYLSAHIRRIVSIRMFMVKLRNCLLLIWEKGLGKYTEKYNTQQEVSDCRTNAEFKYFY